MRPITAQGDSPTFNKFPYQNSKSDGGKMVVGPDGALWFADRGTNSIGNITTSGTITEYPLPNAGIAVSVTSGPGGALWATQRDPNGMNGWIVKMTTTGAATSFKIPFTNTDPVVDEIARGSDGNLWFTSEEGCVTGGCFGRMTPRGHFAFYPTSGFPEAITEGSDGNIWSREFVFGGVPLIARVTPSGVVTEFTIPTSTAGDIVSGGDGNIYYGADKDNGSSKVVQVIPATGAMTIVAHFQGSLNALGVDGKNDIRIAAAVKRSGCFIRNMRLPSFHLTSIALPAGECAWAVSRGSDRNIWYQDGPNPDSTKAIGEVVLH